MSDFTEDFPKQFLSELLALASQSPCSRAQRGAVVVAFSECWADNLEVGWMAIGRGWNGPVTGNCSGELCYAETQVRSETRYTSASIRKCSAVVEHAEAAAIRDGQDAGFEVRGAELIHLNTELVNGKRVPKVSRQPRCGPCAVQAYAYGISGVWLHHVDGWKRYPIEEFYQRSVGLWTS